MPISEIAAGVLLALIVGLSVEVAEVSSRLRTVQLRYRDRIEPVAARASVLDRMGGVALAAVVIWFFALPWVAKANLPVAAFVLFIAMFVVGLSQLGRFRLAAVRYPLATAGPLMVVAGATALT